MPNQKDDPKADPPADPRSDPPADPRSDPRSDPPADPPARILAATVALLGEVGWGGVTTRKVAQRAKVNNALVHYYFGT
ncbi:MAG: helix-turn-helix domain-containing protein, partial [Trueperaceae bacterium]